MIRHENTTQIVKPVTFSPLLKNENPYYLNLNRPPKNAYDYAHTINMVLSYGGYVSRVKPVNSQIIHELYSVVKLQDGEIITTLSGSPDENDRYGIVVTSIDEDGYYIICTFSPNFVYPSDIFTDVQKGDILIADAGTSIYNMTPVNPYSSGVILGKVTGKRSIFFCGTVRLINP